MSRRCWRRSPDDGRLGLLDGRALIRILADKLIYKRLRLGRLAVLGQQFRKTVHRVRISGIDLTRKRVGLLRLISKIVRRQKIGRRIHIVRIRFERGTRTGHVGIREQRLCH